MQKFEVQSKEIEESINSIEELSFNNTNPVGYLQDCLGVLGRLNREMGEIWEVLRR